MAKTNRKTAAQVETVAPEAVQAAAQVETVAPEAVQAPTVAAKAAPGVMQASYAKIAAAAIAGRHSGKDSGGMVAITPPKALPKAGTAKAAAYDCLLTCEGLPRAKVLAKLMMAECNWHKSRGRAPAGVAPAGWLRAFSVTFN